jgi:thymidine phosphorylase
MTGKAADPAAARDLVEEALDSGRAAERFARMVAELGGPDDFVERMDTYLQSAPIIRDVFADNDGQITEIDTRGVGMAVVALDGGRTMPTDPIDYSVGFDRLAPLGASVDRTKPIARIHARNETSAADATARLKAAYKLGGTTPHHDLIAARIAPQE